MNRVWHALGYTLFNITDDLEKGKKKKCCGIKDEIILFKIEEMKFFTKPDNKLVNENELKYEVIQGEE